MFVDIDKVLNHIFTAEWCVWSYATQRAARKVQRSVPGATCLQQSNKQPCNAQHTFCNAQRTLCNADTFCNAQRTFCNGTTARPTNAKRSRYAGDVMPDVIATFKDYLHDFETDLEKDFFKKFMEQVLKHLVFR